MSSISAAVVNSISNTTNLTLSTGNTSGPSIVLYAGSPVITLFSNTSGTSAFVANNTGVSITGAIFANGSPGSTSQVLTSNGSGIYWGSSFIDATLTGNTRINSLGVGTNASGVAGEIRATDNITAYYSSDASLKTNITIIPDALEKVKQIRGVTYDWTDAYIAERGGEDEYFLRRRDVGVIAQEIEAVLPEVVATREDGIKAVKYDRVVALLIEAIKELEAKVNKCNCGCK